MTEQELFNEYRKSNCKSFSDFLINKIGELKADNDARKFAMAMSEKVEKQLREENAELKGIKDVATLIRANNDIVTTLMQLNNMLVSKSQQLTKAKEIIKYLLSFIQKENYKTRWDINIAEAEQFLKDSEDK